MRLYLDANASEPLRPAARVAASAALSIGANPSSVHASGRKARRLLEDAREHLALRLGVAASQVVFTAGGTEANALAIAGLRAGRRVLVGATEHAAVRAAASASDAPAIELPVHADGVVRLDALASQLAQGPALVCLMAANNETGVLHPLADIAALCRAHGALWHCDAVQAIGRAPFDATLPDSVALSGHKLGGPAGGGALVLRPGLHVAPLVGGGGQERGRRGGTEALPAIVGMTAALGAIDVGADGRRLGALRDRIEAGAEGARVAGGVVARLPNTTNLVLPGVAAERQVIALDLAGIEVSAGAACSSGKVARSHVLDAMGLGADAACAIRVSLPWDAPEDTAERFLGAWRAMRDRLSHRAM